MRFTIRRTALTVLAATLTGLLGAASSANAETVMVTGANSGIGLEFTKQYAAKGWTVIATHRRTELPKSLAEIVAKYPKVKVETARRHDEAQVHALATKLSGTAIDVLINNAGVYNDRGKCAAQDEACPGDWTNQAFGKMRYSLLDTIMAVNVKGPLIVSESFYGNVKASQLKKIVAISSSNGTLTGEQPPRPGAIFYRTSKAALNRAMQIVAASVKADGVTVVMLNPGPTLTERQMYSRKSHHAGDVLHRGEHDQDDRQGQRSRTPGSFMRYDGVTEPW